MNYTLIPNYFRTSLFQETVMAYLDRVLPVLIQHKGAARQAKGRFKGRDNAYDMPYHIHILNGLIPMLYLYERYLLDQEAIEDPQSNLYLQVLILGFTFHDANKLSDQQDISLEVALHEWQKDHAAYELADFFPSYEKYLGDICFLALGTENGTESLKNQFPIRLNYRFLAQTLAPFCHLADSLASISQLEDLPAIHQAVIRALRHTPGNTPPPVSIFRLHRQPYILLSQRLMMIARQVCHEAGKPVLFATREGFLYWGSPLTQEEQASIFQRVAQFAEEVNPLGQVKITFQKCSLGFLGSIPLTEQIVARILEEKRQDFLAFSPNREEKLTDFSAFVAQLEGLIAAYEWPIEVNINGDRVWFSYPDELDETEIWFFRLFCLKKFQWLNKKASRKWSQSWKAARKGNVEFPEAVIGFSSEPLDHFADWLQVLGTMTTQTSYLELLFRSMIWAWETMEERTEMEWQALWENALTECAQELSPAQESSLQSQALGELSQRWIQGSTTSLTTAFASYQPYIPSRERMCAFTSAQASKAYREVSAFALKARGGSPHTITTLKNDVMHISSAFAEENQLRKELFPKIPEADLIVYYDFFETNLGISTDLLRAIAKAKDPQVFTDSVLEIDRNARFRYDLMLNFTSLANMRGSASEAVFWFVRSHLLLLKEYGIRTYVSGTMSPYQPHRAAFFFEDAPPLLKALGWQEVRLDVLDQVLAEIKLLLQFPKGKLTSNLHRLAISRRAYFRFFYEEDSNKQDRLKFALSTFLSQYPQLFPNMTTMDHLVSLALPLKLGFRSGADETGLIRTALHYLRLNLKEGGNREQAIQQMAASIDRDLKSETKASKHQQAMAFATAIFDELYVKTWQETLPSTNREKDWIYQFGFLFRMASYEVLDQKKADRAQKWLEAHQLAPTLENVQAWIQQDKKTHMRHAESILALLLPTTT